MPRILFLITDLNLGGSPLVVRDLALGLRHPPTIGNRQSEMGNSFDTAVCSLAPITPTGGGGAQVARMLEDESIQVHTLNASSPRQLLPALARYRTLLKTLRPDLVYSVLIHANFLATLGKLTSAHPHRLIQSIHTLQPTPAWHWRLQGLLLPFADAVVAPSQAILDKLAQFGPFQNARVIPNGIDAKRFSAAEPLKSLKTASGAALNVTKFGGEFPERALLSSFLPPPALCDKRAQPLILGYVGRFDPVKRIDLLLRALTHLDPTTELFLVGYGPAQSGLESLANSLHLAPRVHFVGPTVHPERWYKSFDINVLPSTVEGFGLSIAESLAAGTPVAAFRTPATAAIIRPGLDGVLADEISDSALALAIKGVMELRQSPDWSPQRSQAWIAEQFSLQALIARHRDFLEKFCPKSSFFQPHP